MHFLIKTSLFFWHSHAKSLLLHIVTDNIYNRKTDIMMKRFLMLYAFLLTAFTLFAHNNRVAGIDMVSYPGGKCMLYRLYLKDKDLDHTPYSVNRPEAFLSARSIERRKRQGLPVDLTDLPLAPAYEKAVADAGIEIVGKSKWNNTLLIRIHKEKELRKLDGFDFIRKMMKVFVAPDSVSQRIRSTPFSPPSAFSGSRNRVPRIPSSSCG